MITHQQVQQLGRIQTIALRTPLPPLDLDAGRIDDLIVHTAGNQLAVQPKAIAARFVATDHLGVGWQSEAFLGLGDFLLQPAQVTPWQRSQPRLLPMAGRERKFPLLPAQFERQVQNAMRRTTMILVGRCHV